MELLSAILLPGAFVAGVYAFLIAFKAALTFGVAGLKHVFGRRYSVAKRYLSLEAVALGCLAVCAVLFLTQPVQWPWAPWHIPIYLVIIGLCRFSLGKGKKIVPDDAGEQREP